MQAYQFVFNYNLVVAQRMLSKFSEDDEVEYCAIGCRTEGIEHATGLP
jgi:hypothetical protein